MSLRNKLQYSIIAAVLFFSLLYILMYEMIILPGARKQKDSFTQKMISRIAAAIQSEENRIATLTRDWSNWDAMSLYVQNPDKKFESDSFPDTMLGGLDLDLLLILNLQKQTVFFSNRRNPQARPERFETLEKRQDALWSRLNDTASSGSLKSWLLSTTDGPWILVSSPIRQSDGSPPVMGRLFLGKKIRASFGEKISQALSESCQIELFESYDDQAVPSHTPPQNTFTRIENSKIVYINAVIPDSFKRPAFKVHITLDSNPFHILEKSVDISFYILIFTTILFGLIVFFTVRSSILRRIVFIAEKTEKIASFSDLSVRIPEGNQDEMGHLTRHINQMLERLDYEVGQSLELQDLMAKNEKMAAIGRLASNIAHEIHNPMFAIANTIQVIKKELPPGKTVGEAVSLAEHEIRRVRKIIRELLDYSRLPKDDFSLVDIVEIIQKSIQVLLWSKHVDGRDISFSPPSDPVRLSCNPDGLQQVFMNLIQNAADASKTGDTIRIEILDQGPHVDILFTDQGKGFSDTSLQHVFEPFNTEKKSKGSGLGLYVSNQIVQQHQGQIQFKRDEEGRNQVLVRIPRMDEPPS